MATCTLKADTLELNLSVSDSKTVIRSRGVERHLSEFHLGFVLKFALNAHFWVG